jgi:hypothetical protein
MEMQTEAIPRTKQDIYKNTVADKNKKKYNKKI